MSLMTDSGHRGHSLFAFLMSLESDQELCTCDSEVYLHLWLWSSFASVMWSIYLYELPMMPIVNYLWWMWYLFECGTWLWPNQINWLYVVALPSVTLGKRAICQVPWKIHSATRTRGKNMCILGLKWLLCRVSALWHSAKKACLPSVSAWTLGEETKSWV